MKYHFMVIYHTSVNEEKMDFVVNRFSVITVSFPDHWFLKGDILVHLVKDPTTFWACLLKKWIVELTNVSRSDQ